jgi:succinoglycan biosynthesis transport protein ExoP
MDHCASPKPEPRVSEESARKPRSELGLSRADLESSASGSPGREMPELSELILACRHHLVLTTTLGATLSLALAGIAWLLIAAPYEAESLVRVRQHQDVVFTAQTSRADDAAFVRAQEQLALSPLVLSAALASEPVRARSQEVPEHDATDWLKALLRVDVQAGAEVMSISVQHPSPQFSQTLCNAVTTAYMDEINRRQMLDRQQRQQELQRATVEADRRLDELWGELNQLASQLGSDSSSSLTIRDEIQLQAYRDYAQQLRAAQLRGNELQSMLTEEQLRMNTASHTAEEDFTERLVQAHPTVVAAREQLNKLDSQIEAMRQVVAQEGSPRLQRLRNERELQASELNQFVEQLRPQFMEQAQNENQRKLDENLAQLRKQVELNQAEKEFLRSRMSEIDTSIVRTDEKNGVQLDMARHAVERQTRLADGLWQSQQELQIEAQSKPRVSLIELSQLPTQANHNRQLKAAAGSAALGWMLAILGVGYFEWQGCRVRSSRDITRHSTRPVFGAKAAAESQRRRSTTESGAREVVARMILANANYQEMPSLMVASLSIGEPQHFVALDVAHALASFQRKTLLIDCDLCEASLTRHLAAEQRAGVRQACADRSSLERFIVPSSREEIDFMPLGLSQGAGRVDPREFKRVLESLRSHYDAIVVNSSSILESADCLLLASQVDQTLFSVFAGVSRWDQLMYSELAAGSAGVLVTGNVMHSGKSSSHTMTLQFDRQISAFSERVAEEPSEDSLQENITELHKNCTVSRPQASGLT